MIAKNISISIAPPYLITIVATANMAPSYATPSLFIS